MSWFSKLFTALSRTNRQASGRADARYEAAQTTPALGNHFAYADFYDARAAMSPSVRRTLRSRMRYEDENCAWLNGMLTTAANHIVGNGPRLQILIDDREAADRFEAAWANFWTAISGTSRLKTAVRTDWRDGESVGLKRRAALHGEFRVIPRLYEADQLASPFGGLRDPNIEDGVQIDPESGVPVQYYLLDQHPGSNLPTASLTGNWFDAAEVIHTFREDRPGQLRGIPRGAPGLIDLAAMRRFERATLSAAENAARNAETIETSGGAVTPRTSQADFMQIDLPDGGATFLPEGWKRSAYKPEHPATTYEMFIRAAMTKFARCFGMPYHIAIGSSRESNYSSAILDQTIAWVAEVRSEQARFERQFVEKVFLWFLEEAIFAGGRYAGLLDGLPPISEIPHAWQWDPPPTGDEEDRINVAMARITAGVSSLSTETTLLGRDYGAEERRMSQDLGISIDQLRSLRRTKMFGAADVVASPIADAAAPAQENVAALALNGAQIASLLEIVGQVVDGRLPEDSARAAIKAAFPTLSDAQIDSMLNPLDGFEPQVGADGKPVAPIADPAAAAPGGEFGGLGRRQWKNNVKAVRDVLEDAISGRSSRAASLALLETLGLSPDRANVLLEDALSDGRVDDPEVAEAMGMQSLEAAGQVHSLVGPAVVKLTAAEGGAARRFDILAYTGGKLPVAGAPYPVVVDLTGLEVPNHVPILIDHVKSVDTTLGQVEQVVNDGTQLRLTGTVTGTSQKCLQVLAQADKGQQWQASIGCNYSGEVIPEGESMVVNGQRLDGPFILARSAELRETSVLPMGADSRTKVNLAASAALRMKGQQMPTFEEWLVSKGVDPTKLSADETTALQMAYEALTGTATPTPASATAATPATTPATAAVAAGASLNLQASAADIINAQNKAIADNARRIAAIRDEVQKIPDFVIRGRIEATAIEKNWSLEKTELEVIKELRPKAPAGHVHTTSNSPQVLEAALSLSLGLRNVEKSFDEKTLDAASRDYPQMGLQQMLIACAAANGYLVSPGVRIHSGNIRGIFQAAFARQRGSFEASGPTTLTLPGILSNVANKEILQGYMEEDQTWREIAAIKSVNDFKQVTSYRMLDDMQYDELPPGGTIKHGKVAEESYTRQAKTYAKMLQLDRVDIINDDLSAFDDLRTRLGAGGAKKFNNVFWTKFLDNSSFFTSGRGNYIDGATSNLGTDGVGLGLGVKAFRTMKAPKVKSGDSDSQRYRIGGDPALVIVPPELEGIARGIYLTNPAVATSVSGANIYFNKYRPVVVPWLSDTAFTGYSTTAWYLFREPRQLAAMVVSFLGGQQTPTVESTDADFDTLGVVFRGYHDFGVDQAEYLAGIKSKGAA